MYPKPLLVLDLFGAVAYALASSGACKHIPGDHGFPSPAQWQGLNHTVDGRLIATVPRASVCHSEPFQNFDAEACAALKPEWDFPQAQ